MKNIITLYIMIICLFSNEVYGQKLNTKNKSSLVIVTHSTDLANKCQRQVKLENGKTNESKR